MLTEREQELYELMCEADQMASASDFGEILGISKQRVHTMINHIINKGYAERIDDAMSARHRMRPLPIMAKVRIK